MSHSSNGKSGNFSGTKIRNDVTISWKVAAENSCDYSFGENVLLKWCTVNVVIQQTRQIEKLISQSPIWGRLLENLTSGHFLCTLINFFYCDIQPGSKNGSQMDFFTSQILHDNTNVKNITE